MKKFTLKSDFVFSADSIDDAFEKLSEHFKALCDGEESQLIESGSCEIEPVGGDESA